MNWEVNADALSVPIGVSPVRVDHAEMISLSQTNTTDLSCLDRKNSEMNSKNKNKKNKILLESDNNLFDLSNIKTRFRNKIRNQYSDFVPQIGLLDQFLTADTEFVLSVLEKSFIMYRTFLNVFRSCRDRNNIITEMSYGVLVFSSIFTDKSVTGTILGSQRSLYSVLVNKLDEIFNNDETEIDLSDMLPQDGITDNFRQVRSALDSFSAFKESPLYRKVYKFLLYALSFSLFEKAGVNFTTLGYRKVEEEAARKKYSSRFDFAEVCADTLLYLCETGYQIMKTGEIQPIFHSGTSYEKWYDDYCSIKKQSAYIHSPLVYEEVLGIKFVESHFLREIRECIEKGEAICKYGGKMGQSEKTRLRGMVDSLHMIQCELLTTTKAMENREEPFSILIYGDSKIGKSSIKDMLRIHYAKKQGLSVDPSYCYTVSPTDKHWTNFSSEQHTLIMDDVAFLNPKSAPNGDPTVMNLLQVINGVPFMPEQAALEKKGKTPLRAKLVIATTNTEDLNAHYYFSCPSAVQRRFPYIVIPRVKRIFADKCGFLDSSKILHTPQDYPDRWTWTVKKVDPVKVVDAKSVQRKKANMTTILDKVSLKDFLNFYNKAIEDHDSINQSMQRTTEAMESAELCNLCYMPSSFCDCAQVGELEAYHAPFEFDNDTISESDLYHLGVQFLDKSGLFYLLTFVNMYIVNIFSTVLASTFGLLFTAFWWFGYWQIVQDYITYKLTYLAIWLFANNNHRTWIRLLGQRVHRSFAVPHILGVIAGTLTAAVIITKIRKVFAPSPQSGKSHGVIPTPRDKERDNVWYSSAYETSNLDLTPVITSNKSLDPEYYISLLSKNCVYFNLKEDGVERFTRGFCIKGQYYGLNNHVFDDFKEGFHLTITNQTMSEGVTTNLSFYVSMSQIKRFPERDFALMFLPNMPPRKDITKHFPKSSYRSENTVLFLGRRNNGEMQQQSVFNVRKDINARITAYNIVTDAYMGKVHGQTRPGDCGSLYISFSKLGPAIIGMHSLGKGDCAAAIALDCDFLENVLKSFDFYDIQSGTPELSSETAEMVLGELSKKSIFRYIHEGKATVYGSYRGFKTSMKSKVVPTPMNSYLSNHGYKTRYVAPVMRGYLPWRIAGLDLVNPVRDLDYMQLRKCKEAMLKDLLGSDLDLSMLEIYDDFTTVNGCAGVAYIDKINRSTSAGNPWKCTKKRFLREIPPIAGNQDPVEVNDEIWDRANRIIEKYINKERAHPVFCAHLKDEAVSRKKAANGKTRVFTGAPLDFTLVVRKYLLSVCRLIQTFRFEFESAPGTIAQSPEWGQIYAYLVEHGVDRIIAGDYAKFDKRMAAMLILLAFEILIDLCVASGNYTDDDIKVLWGIAFDTAFAMIDFNGDLVQFFGSNPSGHPLTVIINGLVNSLYMRYCYLHLNPEKRVDNFRQHVNLMTYGDDNIMGVSKEAPWFNHTAISEYLGSLGIGYTMADKEALSVPYIHISEASFLKRSWHYDDDVQGWLAPLDHESIEKSLMTNVASKTLWPGQQAVQIVSTASQEYFFYGKKIFEAKRSFLQNMLSELDCTQCNPAIGEHKMHYHVQESTFPTWKDLYNRFHSYEITTIEESD